MCGVEVYQSILGKYLCICELPYTLFHSIIELLSNTICSLYNYYIYKHFIIIISLRICTFECHKYWHVINTKHTIEGSWVL